MESNFKASQNQVTGITPFSYAAGAMLTILDQPLQANLLAGNFGSEAGLLADAGERSGQLVIAGSNGLPAQSVMLASADDALIGEELFAGGAYLSAEPSHKAMRESAGYISLDYHSYNSCWGNTETGRRTMRPRPFSVFLLVIAIASGLVVLLGYWINLPALATLRDLFVRWATTLAGIAVLVGILNLLYVHWLKVSQPNFVVP